MMTMFPTVPSDDQSRYLAMLCFPKLHDFYTCFLARRQAEHRRIFAFRVQIPTNVLSGDLILSLQALHVDVFFVCMFGRVVTASIASAAGRS